MNIRKGDIVRDLLDDSDRWTGLVVGVKGQVAEIYYPQSSGRIWLPFETLEKLEGEDQKFDKVLFPE